MHKLHANTNAISNACGGGGHERLPSNADVWHTHIQPSVAWVRLCQLLFSNKTFVLLPHFAVAERFHNAAPNYTSTIIIITPHVR
jgi:hypothetical protein